MEAITTKQCWELFFSQDMMNIVVSNTNTKIRKMQEANRASCINETDEDELLAYIGLVYLRGLLGMNTRDISHLYESVVGQAVFKATMSKTRFKLLNATICFDDSETRQDIDGKATGLLLFESFLKFLIRIAVLVLKQVLA